MSLTPCRTDNQFNSGAACCDAEDEWRGSSHTRASSLTSGVVLLARSNYHVHALGQGGMIK